MNQDITDRLKELSDKLHALPLNFTHKEITESINEIKRLRKQLKKKNVEKENRDMTYDELMELCSKIVYDEFIVGGTKNLDGAMRRIFQCMITWNQTIGEKLRNEV